MSTSKNNSNGSNGPVKDALGNAKVKTELTGARLTDKCTAQLDAAVDAIDDSTVMRLSAARREALAQVSSKRRVFSFGTPWAAATVGVAALLVVVLLGLDPLERSTDLIVTDSSPTTLESLPVLSSSEDLEFIQSVDFLVWMEKNSG